MQKPGFAVELELPDSVEITKRIVKQRGEFFTDTVLRNVINLGMLIAEFMRSVRRTEG